MGNVGDSGFMVLRKTSEKFQIVTPPIFQRYGETPFQIGSLITPEMEETGIMNSKPGEGIPNYFYLQRGDVLLAATDGVWDNLTFKGILGVCENVDAKIGSGKEFCREFTWKIMKDIMKGDGYGLGWRKFDDVTMISVKI